MEFIVSSKELKKNQERAIAREKLVKAMDQEAKEQKQWEMIEAISEKVCWFLMGIVVTGLAVYFMA